MAGLRFVFLAVMLIGCADATPSGSSTSTGPLLGVDGSRDQADRNCHVVLRDLGRNWTGFTWEAVGSSWVWQGTIEISEAAASEGLVPSVMFQSGSNPTWFRADAEPVAAAATPGFVRYTVRIDHDVPGPGMSGTALMNTRIQVVPFLELAEGGRLFDHNRNAADLDNYVIHSPDFAIWRNDTVCAPPAGPTRARLVFGADFSERREGILAPGGEMTIVYDTARLPNCRHWRNGMALYDITAHVQFEPGSQRRAVSVRDGAATIAVPSDTRAVWLWFESTSASGCHAWDSNLGANYGFDALVPPQWIGNGQSLIVRDSGDPCDGGTNISSSVLFGTWARQRAVVSNLCFEVYQPGMTDVDDNDLWQKLDVSVVFRIAGQAAWTTRPVNLDRRVGNNARYKLSWRELDPFRPFHCPEVTPILDGGDAKLTLEYYIVVNGGQLRPSPNGAYAAVFADYPGNFWRTQNCGL